MTPNEDVKIINQGVDIAYDDNKTGDTVLFFIHGWGINRTYWADQRKYFEKKYRVVTLDLPGFGASGKNRTDWSVAAYSKDVSAVLVKLDLKNVILIGHSMSGAIALETALANTGRVIGIIGVDNFKDTGVVITPRIEKEWSFYYNEMRKNFKQAVSQGMSQEFFSASTSEIVRNRVLNDILKSDTTMAVDCVENADKYPMAEKLKAFNGKLSLINSSMRQTDTVALQKTGVAYRLFDIGATGHYPMIEKPGDFNLLLQQAIRHLGGE